MKTFYRILTPILSLAVLPVLFFLPIFRVAVTAGLPSSDTKTNLLTTLTGLGEYVSANDLVKLSKNDSGRFSILTGIWEKLPEDVRMKITEEFSCGKFLIAAGVFLAVFILLMLVIAFVSSITGKHAAVLGLSVGAVVSLLATNGLFNAFAKPFLSGAIGLSSLLSANETLSTLGALLGNIVKVNLLQLSIAYTVCLLLAVAIALFSVFAMFEEKYAK